MEWAWPARPRPLPSLLCDGEAGKRGVLFWGRGCSLWIVDLAFLVSFFSAFVYYSSYGFDDILAMALTVWVRKSNRGS